MAVALKPNAVIDKGGNKLILLEMVASGSTYTTATLTVGTYLFDLGYVANSDVNQTTAKQDFEAEDGDIVTSSYTYTRTTKAQLMQSDEDLINLLADTVKGKTYLEGKYTGYINGAHQWHFKICRVTPQFSVKRPGGTTSMEYESTGIKINTTLDIPAATQVSVAALLTLSNYPTVTISITTSKQFDIVEV
jgi:hypothetical protein